MRFIKSFFITVLFITPLACKSLEAQPNQNQVKITPTPSAPITIADKFAYPISKNETVTEAKDKKDEWYNALNFGENDHLGEDWNKNSGGNTDCGEAVYAAANGRVVYAENAGIGWGNVIIIEHTLPTGEKVQSLYGHLLEILKTSGAIVNKRELIGKVGNADGKYLCHLHFEVRLADCPMWNRAGGGYSSDRKGWTDPSDFIDKHK